MLYFIVSGQAFPKNTIVGLKFGGQIFVFKEICLVPEGSHIQSYH